MQHAETIRGLTLKRAELATQLNSWEAEAAKLIQKQRHIDATLLTFGIDCDGNKTIRETFRGENAGFVMLVLRGAGRALTCAEIAMKVLVLRKLDVENARLAWLMEKRVREILGQQMAKGAVICRESIAISRPLLEWIAT